MLVVSVSIFVEEMRRIINMSKTKKRKARDCGDGMTTIEQEKKYTIDDLSYVVYNVIIIIDNKSNTEVYKAIKCLIEQYGIRDDFIDKIKNK